MIYIIKAILFVFSMISIFKLIIEENTDKAYDYLFASLVFFCLSIWIQYVN